MCLFVFKSRQILLRVGKGQHDIKKRFSVCGEIKPHITERATAVPEDAGLLRNLGILVYSRKSQKKNSTKEPVQLIIKLSQWVNTI